MVAVTAHGSMRFGTIVVIGGGCYGSYYARQLGRASHAGKAAWDRLVVVDRDQDCAVARERPAGVDIETADWAVFLARWLGEPRGPLDAIVPSPLMPHLLFDWLWSRARARWPHADIVSELPGEMAKIPWQKAGQDGTRYVSYATWMCPINCIEPATCPHTRGPRDWSLHDALHDAPHDARHDTDRAGRAPSAVLRVTHRVFGVGMVDVADVLAADRMIAAQLPRTGTVQLATASHCHGAVGMLRMASPVPTPSAQGEI